MLRINNDDQNLTLRNRPTNWGAGVYLYNGIPFTGIKVYRYDDNEISAEYEYKDGIPDGRQIDYWPNGNLQEECYQRYDYYVGSYKRWNEQGLLISHQEFDEFGNWVKTNL
jgi:antitoxin component YwqK of YwqJK toxin-antitoxin module